MLKAMIGTAERIEASDAQVDRSREVVARHEDFAAQERACAAQSQPPPWRRTLSTSVMRGKCKQHGVMRGGTLTTESLTSA